MQIATRAVPHASRRELADDADRVKKLPIAPKLGRYRLPYRTDLGRVIYANSVTLTPGTVSVVVDDDTIEVHVLAGEGFGTGPDDEMIRRVHRVEGS